MTDPVLAVFTCPFHGRTGIVHPPGGPFHVVHDPARREAGDAALALTGRHACECDHMLVRIYDVGETGYSRPHIPRRAYRAALKRYAERCRAKGMTRGVAMIIRYLVEGGRRPRYWNWHIHANARVLDHCAMCGARCVGTDHECAELVRWGEHSDHLLAAVTP